VRQIPRRGYVVAPFTQQDIRDLFWAQALLAGELAARAAEKITPDQLAALDDIVKAYQTATKADDRTTIVGLGHAFHRGINLAADSIRLAMLLGSVARTLPLTFYSTIEGWVDASRDEHPQLVGALRKRNAKITRSLMEDHTAHGADRLITTLEERGLWSESPELTG
jgi:DNA-binding GntR family transcriptional regulator